MKMLSTRTGVRAGLLASSFGVLVSSMWLLPATVLAAPSAAQTKAAAAQNAADQQAQAQARAGNTGQALEIGPPVINLTADPGQTIKTQISLRDIANGKLLVKGQVNDFVAAGEDGTPKLLLDDKEENPFSMKTWFGPLPELLLEPKQIKQLPVTINVPANAAPGGYYGVVRFTATPPDLKGTGVSLSASLGSLVLVRVNGNVKESMSVEQFYVGKIGKNTKPSSFFESTPIQFTERIRNSGNIHEQPSGQVTITDMFGKRIATVNINLPPRNVLPNSIRKFEQPLDKSVIGNKKLFGRYTAKMQLAYGGNVQTISDSLTFWVIPYKLIAIAIILLLGGFFALRLFIKRYNQRIISKANNSNRRR